MKGYANFRRQLFLAACKHPDAFATNGVLLGDLADQHDLAYDDGWISRVAIDWQDENLGSSYTLMNGDARFRPNGRGIEQSEKIEFASTPRGKLYSLFSSKRLWDVFKIAVGAVIGALVAKMFGN